MTRYSEGGVPPVFREAQYFRNLWFMIAVLAFMAGLEVFLYFETVKLAQRGVPFVPLLLVMLLMALIMVLLFLLELETEVYPTSFRYRYFPLLPAWRVFDLSEVQGAEAVEYRPLADYGGWGIKYGRTGMWSYTVSGNKGVVVTLKSGKRFLLGSRRPEELQRSLLRPL